MANSDVQLKLYNDALRLCGERKLSSLSENRESQRLLTGVWDGGARDYCLEKGQWNFAARTLELTYSPSITPAFGMRYAFDKPVDLIRLMKFCSDELLVNPELRYQDQPAYWLCDLDKVYVQYVSNDDAFGNDLSLWPQTFRRYVAAYLASRVVARLTSDKQTLAYVKVELKEALTDARSNDAMAGPTVVPRNQGSWGRARGGGRKRYDRA
jgi:hypothetical protein